MSILMFCRYARYIPNSYVKLDDFLIHVGKKKVNYIDRKLTSNLNNVFVKLGAMLLASAYVEQYNGKSNSDLCDVHVNYHLCSFIYYTKSFLDAIAILLNDHYNLGFSKGDIDLFKKRFVDKLESLSGTSITKEIIQKNPWITEVIYWRDSIIHRLSILVAPMDPDTTKDYRAKMPMKPIKIFEEGSLSRK